MADVNEFTNPILFLNGGNIDKLRGPYPTKEAACLAIPNQVDENGKNFREGKFCEIGTDGNYVTHWWRGGYEDDQLVEYVESLFPAIYIDSSGRVLFLDEAGAIGFMIDTDGTVKAANVDVKSLKVNNEIVDFSDYIKTLAFNALKTDVDAVNQTIQVTTDGGFFIADEASHIGLSFIAGVLKTITGAFRQLELGDKETLKTNTGDIIFAMADELTSAFAFAFTKDGELKIKVIKASDKLELGEKETIKTNTGDVIFAMADELTSAFAFAFTRYGGLKIKSVTAADITAKNLVVSESVSLPPSFTGLLKNGTAFVFGQPADYLMIMSYGQSNSAGGGAGLSSVLEKYDALMPNVGSHPQVGANITGFVDYSDAGNGTTYPLIGIMNKFTELINDESFLGFANKGFKFIATAPGEGGKSAEELKKGSAYYARLIDNVTKCKAVAVLESKSLIVPFITWTQGENDIDIETTYAAYEATTKQLIADLNTDIKAITLQKNNIPLVSYQISKYSNSHQDYDRMSKVHLDLGLTHPLFVCACPSYQFDYVLEGSSGGAGGFIVHFTPDTRVIYGHYLAIAAKRTLIDGVKFKPLHPVSLRVNGNNLQVDYYLPFPDGALRFDTSFVTDPGNYGFRVLDAGGNDLLLSNIKIISKNTVSIDCSASPAGGKLLYARDHTKSNIMDYGTLTGRWGARGCLRDNQGDYLKITDLDNYPLHNWAVVSYLSI